MSCLAENTLAEFLQGLLSQKEAARVEEHVDRCADCQAWLKLMAAAPEARGSRAQRLMYDETHAAVAVSGGAATQRLPGWMRPGEVIAARYRIERVVATGGMGVILAAEHLALKQRVALKVMLPSVVDNPDAVGRFLREARAAARLRSEHVGRVIDLDALDDRTPFIAMEYLDGQDLGALLDERKRLPLGEAITLVLQAMEGVAEAHAAGIVHRDLKPANLFLTRRADGSPCVKVLDFGISKVEERFAADDLSTTDSKAFMGSPRYMAPEQLISAHHVDARADIWAFGCILYQLIGGSVPFEGGSLPQLVATVLQTTPRPLAELGVDVPRELEALLHRCLERDRERRVSSLAELAVRLTPFAPVEAGPSCGRICAALGVAPSSFAATVAVPAPEPVGSAPPVAAAFAPATQGRGRARPRWPFALAGVAVLGGALLVVARVREAAPVAATPASVAATPASVAATPAPVAATPAPVAATPAPVAATPAPVAATPVPIAVTPAPVAATPAPAAPRGKPLLHKPLKKRSDPRPQPAADDVFSNRK
jgi:serine/threonine-protein kinase